MDMSEPHLRLLPRPRRVALAGRRVLVLGLGETGLSAAKWIAREGGTPVVADTRAAPPGAAQIAAALPGVALHSGAFDARLLERIDLVCLSPGLSLGEPVVQEAIARGLPVVGDIELFAWRVRAEPASRVVAVTGTNGKTTVTALVGHLLGCAGVDCAVGGNIGPAALEILMRRLDAGKLPAVWVLELSSYQLETTWALEPDAAAVLNITEDHLDRYPGIDAYAAAKARIFLGDGAQVLNRDDPRSAALALPRRTCATFGPNAAPGAADWGVLTAGGTRWLAQGEHPIARCDALGIHGAHNVANALAALALCRLLGAPIDRLAAGLGSFRGLPHRLERVALRGGVAWYDDSKGTNVGATLAALQGLGKPTILILGGEGKGQDFSPLAGAVARHARRVLLIGRDAPRIAAALAPTGVPLEYCATLAAAVARAAACARAGDAVLLSPACASFDMFRDYKHRGEVFADAVRALGA